MRITISLETQAVITQPAPARVKAGGVVPVEIAFTRGSQSVMLPAQSSIKFALKPKNTWTGGLLVFHDSFSAGAGNLYIGNASFATEPILAALGLSDNAPANDIASIEAACEVIWQIGEEKFRSSTFAITVESPLYFGGEGVPLDFESPYPAPEELVTQAPANGKLYLRQDGTWVELPDPHIFTAPDEGHWRMAVSNDGEPVFSKL